MFSGPPLPLPPDTPLSHLFAYFRPPGPLGVWVRGSTRWLHTHGMAEGCSGCLLLSGDLGLLLRHCRHIVLREKAELVRLEAHVIIQWRALQVVMATPYLPGLARLRARLPGLQLNDEGLRVPLGTGSPEEVLAECLAEGVQVTGSHLSYSPSN